MPASKARKLAVLNPGPTATAMEGSAVTLTACSRSLGKLHKQNKGSACYTVAVVRRPTEANGPFLDIDEPSRPLSHKLDLLAFLCQQTEKGACLILEAVKCVSTGLLT